MNELATAVPLSLTEQSVNDLTNHYFELAKSSLEKEGAVFDNEAEREYATWRKILDLCEIGIALHDAVRQRVINHISRTQLFRHAPEGWESLGEMVRDAMPSVSRTVAIEYTAIAEVIIPFAAKHSIPVYEEPSRFGYLREAASALKAIIIGPGDEQEKANQVRRELDWLFAKAQSRADVRARYRKAQGEPALGATAGMEDGQVAMLLVAAPATAEAIRQKINRLIGAWVTGETDILHGEPQTSKASGDQIIHEETLMFRYVILKVFDAKTGELLEEVMA